MNESSNVQTETTERSALGAPNSPPRPQEVSGRILVVDDEVNICRLLQRFLSKLGYEVETAGTVPDAVQVLDNDRFDLVITDLRLPGGPSGLDLLGEIESRSIGTRMILMSAHADITTAAAAIERGIDQLIVKPFELQELGAKVAESLRRRHSQREAEETRAALEDRLRQRETESRNLILNGTLSLAAAVEAKDEYTAGHARRVTEYALSIAEVIGGIDLDRFELAGKLHDVGKIGVPDQVLNKPGRLTAEEFELVKKHPETGERILQPLIDDRLVLGVTRYHHERWDGKGYPDRLAGEDIPLPARILAVADTIDAMTSSRAYRQGLPWPDVVTEIRRCSAGQFDPRMVEAFDSCVERLEQQFRGFLNAAAPHITGF